MYEVILADPPWSYKDKAKAGNRGASTQYDVMKLEDIKSMPIDKIAGADCVLFLWATAPLMREAIEVLESWGFKYKTIGFTWIKKTKNWLTFWGLGHWTRANPEFVLIGIKGKPKRVSAKVHSVIESCVRGHSVKPDEIYERIEELMGPCKRLELFARRNRNGWDGWGNEVPECAQIKELEYLFGERV